MHQIKVANILIDVVRKNIKNLHLAVYPPIGRVRIATPTRVDDDSVRLFAISKLGWIKKQKIRFNNQERQTERKYVSGETHYYRGARYLLNVVYHDGCSKVEIRNKKYIDLYVSKGSTIEQRERVMTEWYRERLKEQLPTIIKKYETKTGIKIKEYKVKQMKTKWGTCNAPAKRIWLNLELAKKPEHCLEYIVVHEMVHLLERKHSTVFTSYMDKFIPQWRVYKKELNSLILNYTDWSY